MSLVRLAIFPNCVEAAVAVTTPRPRPLVTAVPIQLMHDCIASSASACTAVVRLLTEPDSPVNGDSSTRKFVDSSRRRSAGTRLPVSSWTISPGTSNSALTMTMLPFRSTRHVGLSICRSACRARSAFHSWTNPRMPFSTTMARIVMASVSSPIAVDRAAAPIRIQINTSTN